MSKTSDIYLRWFGGGAMVLAYMALIIYGLKKCLHRESAPVVPVDPATLVNVARPSTQAASTPAQVLASLQAQADHGTHARRELRDGPSP